MQGLTIAVHQWVKDEFSVSTDKSLLDIDWIHSQLTEKSWWAREQSRFKTERSIAGSLAFGVYHQGRQVGFARAVTDYTRFVWLCDVIIQEDQRGKGLGSWLASCVREHPELATVHRWMLSTRDTHDVYARLGWRAVSDAEKLMEIPRI